jgi:hypothetical protein
MKKIAGIPASITFSKESSTSFWVVSSSRNVSALSAVLLLLNLVSDGRGILPRRQGFPDHGVLRPRPMRTMDDVEDGGAKDFAAPRMHAINKMWQILFMIDFALLCVNNEAPMKETNE